MASSERLGFLGQAAYHLTRLGRVQHQAGQLPAARQTLTRAVRAAARGGDPRMAATARINLARIMRAAGQQDAAQALLRRCDDWYHTAGGGDGALLTRAMLAARPAAGDAELEYIAVQAPWPEIMKPRSSFSMRWPGVRRNEASSRRHSSFSPPPTAPPAPP